MLNNDEYFDIYPSVIIRDSGLPGIVVDNRADMSLVRYITRDGEQCEDWMESLDFVVINAFLFNVIEENNDL